MPLGWFFIFIMLIFSLVQNWIMIDKTETVTNIFDNENQELDRNECIVKN